MLQVCGHDKTVIMLDKLKELGFREATKSGVSIGIDDMIVPKERDQEIETRTARFAKSRSNIARVSSPRRTLQQDRRHLDALHGPDFAASCSAPSNKTRARRNTTPFT
jgi:DNA-directed RNA polymerase beta' subunit